MVGRAKLLLLDGNKNKKEYLVILQMESQPAPFVCYTSKCIESLPKTDNDTVKRQACTYLASGDMKCEDKWLQTGYNNILQNEKNKTVPMADAMSFLRPF